jgi:hypothetical protein
MLTKRTRAVAALAALLSLPAGAQPSGDAMAEQAKHPSAALKSFQLNDRCQAIFRDASSNQEWVLHAGIALLLQR